MSLLPHSSAEQNPYQAPIIHSTNNSIDRMTAEPASPWARIGAVLINTILYILTLLPLFIATIIGQTNILIIYAGGAISITLLLVLIIWQSIWMVQRGQSIGKKLMNIRVINQEGQIPSFKQLFWRREFVFIIVARVIIKTIIILLVIIHVITNDMNAKQSFFIIMYLSPYLICLPMLFFPNRERRTLQDYLAKTLVVKA